MAELFLVFASDGEYSDHYSTPIHAWSERQKADNHVTELEQEQTVHNSFVDLYQRLSAHYDSNTPALRNFDSSKLKKEPKWNNLRKHQITDDMRAERQRIRDYNQQIHMEYGQLRIEWETKKRGIVREQLVQNNAPQKVLDKYDHYGYLSHLTRNYSVDPIELD